MNKSTQIKVIEGGKHTDKNGAIGFINDFSFDKIKRFYFIELPKKKMIRAFHGHMKESKAVFVIQGSIILNLARIDNPKKPDPKQLIKRIILTSKETQICIIPKGFANGIMSLEKNTKVIIYSDKTTQESIMDDFRYDENYWGKNAWKN